MEHDIEVSRANQINRKKIIKEKEQQEEKDFADFWKVRNKELQDLEERERLEEIERNKELTKFRRRQFDEKEKIKEEEYRKDQKAATKAQALLDQQEKHFYNYAEKAIKEWKDQGKNVTPLLLELKGQAKYSHKP